jgi:hypothetical protein
MAYSLVAHVKAGTGASGGTSSAIDTSGADFLIMAYAGTSTQPVTVSDSKSGNTWTPLTSQSVAGGEKALLYYAPNATVGSGHTFTVSGGGIFAGFCVAAFSGSKLASPFDVENKNSSTSSSVQTGSVTPSENNELVVVGFAFDPDIASSIAIDSSFVFSDKLAYNAGNSYGAALAYLIQGTAGAVNPTASWTGSANVGAVIATFKASATGSVLGSYYYRLLAGIEA